MKKKKIWQRLTKANWCKRVLDRPLKNGRVAHCALGWIDEVYNNDLYKMLESMSKLTMVLNLDSTTELVEWNDARKRTFEEVKAAFKVADI